MITTYQYVLDADVFIAAKNAYYSFPICPGFWESMIFHHDQGHVCSIDRVRSELLAGRPTEDLVQWVNNDLPKSFFLATDMESVMTAYAEIMLWVQRSTQYFDQAKAKFATEADGWLTAHAMVHGNVVVTNEQPRPESRNRILLPDVCRQFDVSYKDTFSMLHDLVVRFEWSATP